MHLLSRLLSRLIYRISRKAASYDRIEYVRVGFMLFGVFILWTAFRLTVLEHDFYRTLADKQQTITVKNPVSRGTIYSVNTPAGVFATSTDLPDLAVDPCVKSTP
jgi:cell division protein FtsI/penicillin-binding protein 2